MTPTTISVAIIMVAVCIAAVVWLQGYRVTASAKRMLGMMARVGLDPATGTRGTRRTRNKIGEMRRRCMRCPREDLCDRWLAGEVEGGNAFCPNAREFDIMSDPGVRAG